MAIIMEWDSVNLIGKVRERFDEIFRPDRRWNEWRSFYNGWLEGRIDMLSTINKEKTGPHVKGLRLEVLEDSHVAYEFHNHETGHCYVDYIDHEGMTERDGYTKTMLYKIEEVL